MRIIEATPTLSKREEIKKALAQLKEGKGLELDSKNEVRYLRMVAKELGVSLYIHKQDKGGWRAFLTGKFTHMD